MKSFIVIAIVYLTSVSAFGQTTSNQDESASLKAKIESNTKQIEVYKKRLGQANNASQVNALANKINALEAKNVVLEIGIRRASAETVSEQK